MKAQLSLEETQMLNEIIEAAQGVGRLKEQTLLNERQIEALRPSKSKGYVMLTKKKFMVVAVP